MKTINADPDLGELIELAIKYPTLEMATMMKIIFPGLQGNDLSNLMLFGTSYTVDGDHLIIHDENVSPGELADRMADVVLFKPTRRA